MNGRARISIGPALIASSAIEGKAPRSVLIISIDTIFFQCARALVRSDLWNAANHVSLASIPTAGQILAALTADRVGGESYDKAWPERAKQTMW